MTGWLLEFVYGTAPLQYTRKEKKKRMTEQEFFKYAYYLIVAPKDDAELEEFTNLRKQYYKIKQGEIEE